MIFTRYLTRLFIGRVLGALAAFTALVEILDLFDAAGDILARGEGIAGLGHYAVLRLPVIVVDVAPFAVLIGALFTFMGLASKSEVVAMRALGLPPRRIVMFLAPAALLVGGLHVIASDLLAPPAESALRDWMLRTTTEAPAEEADYWIRSGPVLVGFAAAAPDGSRLDRVLIYERDAEGQLVRRIAAARAAYEGSLWRLDNARVNGADAEDRQQDVASLDVDLHLAPEDVLELSQPLEHLSFARLYEGATGGPTGARSQAYFNTRMMAMWALLAAPPVMLVIAGPAAFGSQRRGTIGIRVAIGLGWGLLFVLFAGILRTLGESGVLPPIAAVWTAPLAFALLAAARFSSD